MGDGRWVMGGRVWGKGGGDGRGGVVGEGEGG